VTRNNQVTRQWHLLRRLEGSTGLTLQALADGLPDDIPRHLRTVRRDLAALESVGFPMITDHAGVRPAESGPTPSGPSRPA
jgi:predicted DNA-binding transcriptional regulator YafY